MAGTRYGNGGVWSYGHTTNMANEKRQTMMGPVHDKNSILLLIYR